ncbi:hypothetical protein QTN25_005120 [Entamoeba marina]
METQQSEELKKMTMMDVLELKSFFQDRVDVMQDKIYELERELSTQTSRRSNAESISKMMTKLNEQLQKQIQKKENELEEISTTYRVLVTENSALQSKHQQVEKRLNDKSVQVNQLQAEIIALNEANKILLGEVLGTLQKQQDVSNNMHQVLKNISSDKSTEQRIMTLIQDVRCNELAKLMLQLQQHDQTVKKQTTDSQEQHNKTLIDIKTSILASSSETSKEIVELKNSIENQQTHITSIKDDCMKGFSKHANLVTRTVKALKNERAHLLQFFKNYINYEGEKLTLEELGKYYAAQDKELKFLRNENDQVKRAKEGATQSANTSKKRELQLSTIVQTFDSHFDAELKRKIKKCGDSNNPFNSMDIQEIQKRLHVIGVNSDCDSDSVQMSVDSVVQQFLAENKQLFAKTQPIVIDDVCRLDRIHESTDADTSETFGGFDSFPLD